MIKKITIACLLFNSINNICSNTNVKSDLEVTGQRKLTQLIPEIKDSLARFSKMNSEIFSYLLCGDNLDVISKKIKLFEFASLIFKCKKLYLEALTILREPESITVANYIINEISGLEQFSNFMLGNPCSLAICPSVREIALTGIVPQEWKEKLFLYLKNYVNLCTQAVTNLQHESQLLDSQTIQQHLKISIEASLVISLKDNVDGILDDLKFMQKASRAQADSFLEQKISKAYGKVIENLALLGIEFFLEEPKKILLQAVPYFQGLLDRDLLQQQLFLHNRDTVGYKELISKLNQLEIFIDKKRQIMVDDCLTLRMKIYQQAIDFIKNSMSSLEVLINKFEAEK